MYILLINLKTPIQYGQNDCPFCIYDVGPQCNILLAMSPDFNFRSIINTHMAGVSFVFPDKSERNQCLISVVELWEGSCVIGQGLRGFRYEKEKRERRIKDMIQIYCCVAHKQTQLQALFLCHHITSFLSLQTDRRLDSLGETTKTKGLLCRERQYENVPGSKYSSAVTTAS